MTEIRIDFAGVKPWAGEYFVRIPAGDYMFIIDLAEIAISRRGNEMVRVVHLLNGNGETNVRMYDHFVLDAGDHHRSRLASLFASVGVKRENPSYSGIEDEIDALVGRSGICTIKDRRMEATDVYAEKVVSDVAIYCRRAAE